MTTGTAKKKEMAGVPAEPDWTIEAVPSFVRALRKRAGWSQEELARRLGISWVTVHRWESGASVPSRMARRLIRRLAREGVEGDREDARGNR